MLGKQIIKKSLLVSILLLSAIGLSSCAKSAYSKELEQAETTPEVIIIEENEETPAETETIIDEENINFLTHEGARDIALQYLIEKYGLESPDVWETLDQTPENLVGSSAIAYTSGAWVAFVKAPVVAPEYLVYSIEIDNVAHGLRWVGEVDAQGELKETSASGPMQVLSSIDARNLAAEYIQTNYGWKLSGEWQVESMQPIENAGIRQTFTAGPWVIQVEYLAGAPIVPEYKITVDNLTLVARWEGTIQANGDIIEESYISE